MSACNKRKQIKPQKVFETKQSPERSTQIEDNPPSNIKNKPTQSHQPAAEPGPNFNDLFAQKLKDLMSASTATQPNTQVHTHTDVIQLIEQIILTNIMPIFTSLTNLKTTRDSPAPEPTKPIKQEPQSPPRTTSTPTTNTANQTDLIKESIEKFFSDNDSKVDYLNSSAKFDAQNKLPTGKQNRTSMSTSNSHNDSVESMRGCFPSNSMPIKMVRGQEEWVNNSRHKSFISQILKCLECSASFDSLADLSVHMLNSNHFLKFQANASNPKVETHLPLPRPVIAASIPRADNQKSAQFNQRHANKNLNLNKAQNRSESSGICRLKNSIPSRTMCQICNKTFDHLAKAQTGKHQQVLPPLVRLIQHLQNTHKIEHICTNCGCYFKTSEQLQRHLIEETYSHHYVQQAAKKQAKIANRVVKSNEENFLTHSRKRVLAEENNFDLQHKRRKTSPNSRLSVSVSPALSTSDSASSASYSTNSSPNSFVFDYTTNHRHAQQRQEDIAKVQSSNTGNHLLALQMLVNGDRQLDLSSSIATGSCPLSDKTKTTDAQKERQGNHTEAAGIKLPAKKRPYVETKEEPSTNEKRLKKDELLLSENSVTAKENACHPLNLLQRMHLCLDDYFVR